MVKFKLFRLIILTSILFFFCIAIWAQPSQKNDSTYLKKTFPKIESRSSLIISGSFMHSEGKQNLNVASDASSIIDYYLFPVNPGLRIYYQYQIYKENYLLYGLDYQICSIASTEDAIHRFRYGEPSISIFFKYYFHKNENIPLFSTIGLSYGRMKLLAIESYGHMKWSEVGTTHLKNYSDNDTFIDLVFTTGICSPSSHIEIAPVFGYRLKDNWMGFYRHRFFYGLLINYQLKFSKK